MMMYNDTETDYLGLNPPGLNLNFGLTWLKLTFKLSLPLNDKEVRYTFAINLKHTNTSMY